MKKILFILLLLPFFAESQTYQSMPQAGYGPVKRMLFDSVLTIPLSITSLRNISGGRDVGQLRYNVADSSPYIYSGYQWIKIGGGTGSSQWTDVTGGINYSAGNVGIGTSTPGYKLDVNGTAGATDLEITNSVNVGNGVSTGGVLHADGNLETQDSVKFTNLTSKVLDTTNYKPLVIGSTGNVHKTNWFSSGGGSSWSLTGNPLTTSANFIGTTDAQPFRIVVNNDTVGKWDLSNSIAFGSGANFTNTGTNVYSFGANAGNNNTGNYVLALGVGAAANNSGEDITAIGANAGDNNSGTMVLLVGTGSGESNKSNNSMFIGTNAKANEDSVYENANAIGSSAFVEQSNSMVLGSINGVNGATASTNVGIGTTTPTHLLHISAADSNVLRLQGLIEGLSTDSMLTIDSDGRVHKRVIPTGGGSSIQPFQAISDVDTTLTNVQASYLFKDISVSRTITLPASPTDGLEIQITSYWNNSDSYTLTILPNTSQDIEGLTSGYVIGVKGTVKLKWYDTVSGWQIINEKL